MSIKSKNELKIEEFKKFFSKLKNNRYFGRLGKVFRTEKKLYFLDTGTGKIAEINENVYYILKSLFENDKFESLYELDLCEDNLIRGLEEIKIAVEKEHILSAPNLETLTGQSVTMLEEMLSKQMGNITLEVTERCNLRCKYCIYNSCNESFREFGHRDMNFETAKKAIDFYKEHSVDQNKFAIGFYGGEPLLNFELIKKCITYSKKIFKDEKLIFAMTTNATLLTEEIAEFLVKNGVILTISLDGPRSVHDENRIYPNGQGTFDDVEKGIKNLVKSYKKYNLEPMFSFNIVTSGPNYYEKYNMINDYLKNTDWIPENIAITCSTVDGDPSESKYILPQSNEEKTYFSSIYEPLADWTDIKKQQTINNELFSQGDIDKGLLRIHKRLLFDNPVKQYGMNGCCVPGQRKLYVTVDGDFYPCEKVGAIPSLGNVDSGFNFPKIKKYYVEDFINEAKKYCKNCWAVNLCSLCYVKSFNKNGIHINYRHKECIYERHAIENNLIRYHYLYEKNPKELEHLNEIDII